MAFRVPLAWIGWILLGAVLALPALAWQGDWFDARHWPIRHLRVESENIAVPVADITTRAGSRLDGGFFGVDLVAVRAAVMENPWVERVEVRRQFPDRLVLRVDERKPVASFGESQLLSSRGALFDVAQPYWPEGLPRLSGPAAERARLFHFWQEANDKFARLGMPVVAARMSDRGAFTLELDNGCEVVFARTPGRGVLDRFLVSLAELDEADRARLARVDLRYANGYVVVWKAPEPAMPVLPEAAPAATGPVREGEAA